MGLDMYLTKRQNDDNEEVGYWRKANSIHNWFVQNVQNGFDECQESLVSKEDLESLLEVCKKVLEIVKLKEGKILVGDYYGNISREKIMKGGSFSEDAEFVEGENSMKVYERGQVIANKEEIAKILPTTSGFFFGSTDYDEYYLNDIKDTIEILEKVLQETDFDKEEIYYQASW